MANKGAPDALKPGDDVAGKYTIEATIGVGGMGIVYRALHRRIEQQVAIKMLLPSMLEHPEIVARFEREARAAGQLRSRHTARVIDVGELDDGGTYMVMEFLQGQDLGNELELRGPLPIAEAVEWVTQACSAMAEAHDRGIVHRDLKPANLFLAEEEEGRILKVLDFGISKVEETSGRAITSTQATMGTPLYMSPEQVRATKQVDARTDIWSLGVILYELLTGRTPFEGAAASVGAAIVSDEIPPLASLRDGVPPDLVSAVGRALSKSRDDRFPDARSFAAAIAPFSLRAPSRTSQAVRPSDPELVARTHDSMRAPTLAVGDVAAPAQGAAQGAVKPITDIGWTASKSAPRRRTPFALVAAFGAVLVAGSGAFFVMRAREAPKPTTTSAMANVSAPPPATSIPPTDEHAVATSAELPSNAAPVRSAPAPSASVALPAAARTTRPPPVRPPDPTTKPTAPPRGGDNPVRL